MKSRTVTISTIALLAASLVAGGPVNSANITTPNDQPSLEAAVPEYIPCTYETKGIDLPGNDVGSRSAPDPAVCYSYCYSDSSCKAWTWSDYQGGTCWLKSGYNRVVVNDRAVSAIYYDCTAPVNSQYLVIENCDIKGFDDFSRPGSSYWSCIGVAGASFTWSDYNGGTCWYKTSYQPCGYAPNKYTGRFIQ